MSLIKYIVKDFTTCSAIIFESNNKAKAYQYSFNMQAPLFGVNTQKEEILLIDWY